MRVRTVCCTYTKRFNIGNYESVEFSVLQTADLEQEDDERGTALLLLEEAKRIVHQAAKDDLSVSDSPSAKKHLFMGKEIESSFDFEEF